MDTHLFLPGNSNWATGKLLVKLIICFV